MIIVTAKLKKKATADGLFEFNDDVELGREYLVDCNSVRVQSYWNTKHQKMHHRPMIQDLFGGWLPTECLEIPCD